MLHYRRAMLVCVINAQPGQRPWVTLRMMFTWQLRTEKNAGQSANRQVTTSYLFVLRLEAPA